MAAQKLMYIAYTISAALFIFAAIHQWAGETVSSLHNAVTNHLVPSEKGLDSKNGGIGFEEIAKKYGTDKVTTHKYQFMYDKYLSQARDKRIKVLEIGLGCNMDYGPGASYYTWLEYLPHVDLYFIEYDAECAEKYQEKTKGARIFVGDQADIVFLTRFSGEATMDGLFDVIIDDGGHTMGQQITSLESLWKIVKPGGLYVIEDLQTSFWESFGGDQSANNQGIHTTMKYLYQILDDVMTGRNSKPISHNLRSLECMSEICALQKAPE